MMLLNIEIGTLACLTVLLIAQDMVPLGRWNNLGRSDHPASRSFGGTAVNAAVGLVPLFFAWRSRHTHSPAAGQPVIAVVLTVVLLGAIYSWWLPWLVGTNGARQAALQDISRGTLSFLPPRHGITPNALHCVLHLLTAAALGQSLFLL